MCPQSHWFILSWGHFPLSGTGPKPSPRSCFRHSQWIEIAFDVSNWEFWRLESIVLQRLSIPTPVYKLHRAAPQSSWPVPPYWFKNWRVSSAVFLCVLSTVLLNPIENLWFSPPWSCPFSVIPLVPRSSTFQSSKRLVTSAKNVRIPPKMTTNIQQGTLLDVLKKKMRQTKEEMEKYKDECEEFHKRLQVEVMRREEVSRLVTRSFENVLQNPWVFLR